MFFPKKRLPLNYSTFSDIRSQNRIYVDKTEYIAQLVLDKGPFFLARPRRFGKSTLVSTFHTYFEQGIKAFEGLNISKFADRLDNKTYKVIHLDFSMTQPLSNETFNDAFVKHLLESIKIGGLVCTCEEKKGSLILSNTLQGCEDSSVVILIDEYDAPLTDVLDDEKEFNERKKVLNDFFSAVKKHNGYLRFIFLTGVAKFSQLSIFSAFNTLQDISFDYQFGNIVGYTQDELETYFGEYIENASYVLNEDEDTNKYTKEYILKQLKINYDGYSFDEKARCHVYNPWSILNFLQTPNGGFKPYWVLSGGAYPALLRNYVKKLVDNNALNSMDLDALTSSSTKSLSPNFSHMPDATSELQAILYQAGYYSIKSATKSTFKIGIPNLEVKAQIAELMFSLILKKKEDQNAINDLHSLFDEKVLDALETRDFESVQSYITCLFNEISYETIKNFTESAFRDLLKVTLILFGVNAQSEVHSALGRADLVITTDTTMYVIELKIATSEQEIGAKRDEAIKQLIERKYADRATSLDVIPLVMVILNEAKSSDEPAKFKVPVLEDVRQVKLPFERKDLH